MKRPGGHLPHLSGLYELDRLADETVALAEQIKDTVAELRRLDDAGDPADDAGE